AETAHHDAVLVDRIKLAGMIQGFEQVDLAGELVGAAVAAVGVQDEGAGGGDLAGLLAALVEEGQFAEGFAAAVAPDIEAGGRTAVALRHDHAVGLHRAVDLRAVAAHDEALLGGPGRAALLELGGAFEALG